MKKYLLKTKAIKFESLLLNYSKSKDEAHELFIVLSVNRGFKIDVKTPLEWRDIRGSIFFSEGDLAKFFDLEQAFAEFRIELTGGEPLALSRLRYKGGKT